MHAICDSNIGVIRKEIKNIKFYKPPEVSPISETIKESEIIKLKWYQKVWIKIKKYVKNFTNS